MNAADFGDPALSFTTLMLTFEANISTTFRENDMTFATDIPKTINSNDFCDPMAFSLAPFCENESFRALRAAKMFSLHLNI